MAKERVLTAQSEDFPRWYQDVVAKAELADNGPVRGTIVIRPYGYAIWERIQAELDARIKAAGASNAYFPLLIPESYLQKEAEHVEGFSPELAVVTHAGGKKLDEPVVVRPTSETIVNSFFSKWIQSYRDLPLLLNQWSNVVRWELRPRLFLRTTEFLWQEGHTAQVAEADARAFALKILTDVYRDFMVDVMAVPVLIGRKTAQERFAGATTTWTCEAMMRDGKALQMGTSHELGQNFARAFDITFLDESGTQVFAWQTSWGVSTRLMGAMIMVHGDDSGLRVPPRLAAVQAVVLVARDEGGAAETGAALAAELNATGIRTQLDTRTDTSFGRRVVDWELKGVPARLEVGPRDVAAGTAVVARRGAGTKETVALAEAVTRVATALEEDQQSMLAEATELLRSRTVEVTTVAEAADAAQSGFALIPWRTVGVEGEEVLRKSGASVRCLRTPDREMPNADGSDDAELVAVIGRAY